MSRCVIRRQFVGMAFLLLLVVVVGSLAPLARAANTFADIQYWVGSGSNQAAFVMDWKDGKSPQSLLWGYRWDGAATGSTMLSAIANADPRFFAHIAPGATALYGAGYDVDNDGVFNTSAGASMGFDANGVATNNSHFDGSTPTDGPDHWREGWFSDGYWSYWIGGNGASPAWDASGVGSADRTLTNGSWDGWSYAPGFDGVAPLNATPAVPAPEPASIGVLVIGALSVLKRRR